MSLSKVEKEMKKRKQLNLITTSHIKDLELGLLTRLKKMQTFQTVNY